MRFLSLFSGIEAASVAWLPLGWTPVAFAEIDPFACALLKHHYPDVPNLGDVSAITDEQIAALGHIDLVCFGFPCQDVSVAGTRGGFTNDDGTRTRSGLFHEADRIVRLAGARWAVIENVPGLLSSQQGRDFGTVVGTLAGCDFDVPDGGWRDAGVAAGPRGLVEWATLDAQFFDLAQRRRRVFLVLDTGDWAARPPVLLERESLSGHPPPSREAGADVASAITRGLGSGGADDVKAQARHIVPAMTTRTGTGTGNMDEYCIAHSLTGEGFDASEDGTGRGVPLVAYQCHGSNVGEMGTLRAGNGNETGGVPFVAEPTAFNWQSGGDCRIGGSVGRTDALQRSQVPAVVTPFDTTQMTSALNRSQPKPGDPCHPLAAGAHPPAIAFSCKDHGADAGEIAPTLRAMEFDESHANGGGQVAVACSLSLRTRDGEVSAELGEEEVANALRGSNGGRCGEGAGAVLSVQPAASKVRRLTPVECARLQGFPDTYLDIIYRGKPAADGPKYRALGNSWAIPCVEWIARRIAAVAEVVA